MYVNNPDEKAMLPELDKASIIEQLMEEPPDPREAFWEEASKVDSARSVDYHGAIHAQVCRFNSRGEHVIMARDCPHFETEDEEGKTIQKGWTAQIRN